MPPTQWSENLQREARVLGRLRVMTLRLLYVSFRAEKALAEKISEEMFHHLYPTVSASTIAKWPVSTTNPTTPHTRTKEYRYDVLIKDCDHPARCQRRYGNAHGSYRECQLCGLVWRIMTCTYPTVKIWEVVGLHPAPGVTRVPLPPAIAASLRGPFESWASSAPPSRRASAPKAKAEAKAPSNQRQEPPPSSSASSPRTTASFATGAEGGATTDGFGAEAATSVAAMSAAEEPVIPSGSPGAEKDAAFDAVSYSPRGAADSYNDIVANDDDDDGASICGPARVAEEKRAVAIVAEQRRQGIQGSWVDPADWTKWKGWYYDRNAEWWYYAPHCIYCSCSSSSSNREDTMDNLRCDTEGQFPPQLRRCSICGGSWVQHRMSAPAPASQV